MEFSLLLPTYTADDPAHLERAFESAVEQQNRRPGDVVIVRDGPVPAPLEAVLDGLVRTSPVPVQRVDLAENVGLGRALDIGLRECRHDVVARMDADDVSLPHRFEVQLPVVERGYDLVGSALWEFGADENDVLGVRTPPIDEAEIRRRARFADPFNHPTVVYRRAAVQAAGGYRDLSFMEDYWLFARMIEQGARVTNVAEPLVKYRVGAGAYARRGGWPLLLSELRLQREFRASGFTSRRQFVRNVVVRGGYRLVPESARKAAYRRLVASRGSASR